MTGFEGVGLFFVNLPLCCTSFRARARVLRRLLDLGELDGRLRYIPIGAGTD